MNPSKPSSPIRLAVLALTAVAALGTLSACTPLLVGGAVTTAFVVTDRRTVATQLEDQGIELRAASRMREHMGTRARVAVNSYNRRVLLTGEAANERDRALAAEIVAQVDNVVAVVNEIVIANSPSLSERAADTLLTGRLRAAFVDAPDLAANALKVVSERGTVYLMGRVTQREADRATEITRNMQGVQRVVRLLEIISEEELARLQPRPAAPATPEAPAQ